jgi:hypothetical protein
MRAGLLAAAFVLAAASPAVAAPAQVPCSSIGNDHYECNWYRPGNGYSGGSLVVVGTTTVGYLPQGKNWIICQQVGGNMRNPEGDKNNWFGWTEAENGKMGWASPLDAVGGDDYGSFGGGTPNCDNAHGSPPTWSGVWGVGPDPGSPGTPAPVPAPKVDADQDGYPADADCDDLNRFAHPGAPDVPGDGVDQDCSGADTAGKLSAIVRYDGTYTRKSTRLKKLQVAEAPPGANVSVTCKGKRKGCPKPRTATTSAKGSVSLSKMFRKRHLPPGAVITVQVTAPNLVGRVKRLTIRRNKVPRVQNRCLIPGADKPSKC